MVAEGAVTLNRTLHPWAWWSWAIGVGLAVSGTTNPLLLALVGLSLVIVVLLRRSAAPWARSVRAYLFLALFVIGMRVLFQIVIGSGTGATVLLSLPEVPLPDWAAGIRLGGAVTAEGLVFTVYGALRLAVLLLCIGAANALANPRQALRSVPAALYEVSVAVVIALSVAPQLIESTQRVHRARRLRGSRERGLRALGRVVMPVFSDAIERSLALAAGMEARGFGRTAGAPVRGTLPLMLVSTMGALLGGFLVLSTPWVGPALGVLAAGVGGTLVGLRLAGARLQVTRYRPHPWGWVDTAVALMGLTAAVVVLGVGSLDPAVLSPASAALLQPAAFFPSTDPLAWPDLTAPMAVAVAAVLAPLPLTMARRPRVVEATRRDSRVRSPRPRTTTELSHS